MAPPFSRGVLFVSEGIARETLLAAQEKRLKMPSVCDRCQAPAETACGRCLSTAYCSVECQRSDWKKHKLTCYSSGRKLEPRVAAKIVLILELESLMPGNPMYSPFLDSIRETYTVQTSSDSIEAAAIVDSTPHAIIVAAGGITRERYSALAMKLEKYVRKGGIVLHGMDFAGTSRPSDLDEYWNKVWNLPWSSSSYERVECKMNPVFGGAIDLSGLRMKSEEKALFVTVTDERDAIYLSAVVNFGNTTTFESQAVCRAIGSGRVAYIGDVNGEDSSIKTSKRILGLPI